LLKPSAGAHDRSGVYLSEPEKNVLPGLSIFANLLVWRNNMKSSTKDKINGLADKIKGNVKEGIGSLSGNHDLEKEGKNDQSKGEARKKIGEIKKVFNR
jgi:uncharacterized protein YjbJ (UPF0337 family)